MSATTLSLAPDNSTDANFRLWGKAISDQLAAGGWVKTSDTGQIDWATVTKPTTANTSQGYEIWRSNDAGGGINQIYLKLEYGGASPVTKPSIWHTVGFASNGSGTLTGNTSTRTQLTMPATATTTTYTSYLSATAGRFCFLLFSDYTTGAMGLFLERTLDSSLNPKNAVLIMHYIGSLTYISFRQVVNQTLGAYPSVTSPTTHLALIDANSLQSGNAGLSLIFGSNGGLTNPSSNILGVYSTNLGATGTQISIDTYGSAINYIICTPNSLASNINMLMRYD